MPRFFINPTEIKDTIVLKGENAKHIQVLRYNNDDAITVCDGKGIDYNCLITSIKKDEVTLAVQNSALCLNEPDIKITLFQAVPKASKFDMVIQKSVELGVHRIVPVYTEYTIVKKLDTSKLSRLNKISEAAAKQSERGIIPPVEEPIKFNEAVAKLTEMEEAFFFYEKAPVENKKLLLLKNTAKEIGILVGPEGGFSTDESEFCVQKGLKTVSLGRRILRTETAGFTAIAILLFYNSDY